MMKYGMLALIVALLDQLIKALVRQFPLQTVFYEIPGLFSLMRCINTGAAFSMLSGHTYLLAVFSFVLLAAVWMYAAKAMRLTSQARAAIACLVGGGIGNLLDRLLHSGVTDYIRLQFIDFPVFNLADIAITGSVAALLLMMITNAFEVPMEDGNGSDN